MQVLYDKGLQTEIYLTESRRVKYMHSTEKRTVVMDLGSQTFRMAVAKCTGNDIRTAGSWLENVRLGQGLSETGRLNSDAVKRGLQALERFKGILRDMEKGDEMAAAPVTAVGTAALRNAENALDFLEAAEMMNGPFR